MGTNKRIKHTKMIAQILKDPLNYIGSIGVTMMLAVEWLATNVTPVLGLIAGIGGLIMLVFSIVEKIKRNRILDMEMRIKNEEHRRLFENKSS